MGFAGFDSLAYPGDDVMASLKEMTNFSFVGFYLAPAPCRGSSAWMPRRGTLAGQGWGFLPVYVGQQEVDPSPHSCKANTLTPEQGDSDGRAAAELMDTAGFPANSAVYLDIERGGPASAAMLSYVGAWVDAITAAGTYLPGVYCSHTTAASVLAARPALFLWTFNLKDLGPSSPSFPTDDPAGCGVAQATAWQYAQNHTISFADDALPPMLVDLNCASLADPSQPLPAPATPVA